MVIAFKHAKTNNIPDWTQADMDKAAARYFAAFGENLYPPGSTIADITLSGDWNNGHILDGADPNLILFTDGSGNLAQDADLSYSPSTKDFILGGSSLAAAMTVGGTFQLYDSSGNLNISAGAGTIFNADGVTSSTVTIKGSSSQNLLFAYPQNNTVTIGSTNDLGGTLGVEAISSAEPTLVVKAAAAQITPAISVQDSSGSSGTVFTVTPQGIVAIGNGSSGAELVPSTGTLTMRGKGGTNNENLIFNFETVANVVSLSSGTSANLILATSRVGVGASTMTLSTDGGDVLTVAGNLVISDSFIDRYILYKDTNVAHGMTSIFPSSDSVYQIRGIDGSNGGGQLLAATDDTSTIAVQIRGIQGNATMTAGVPCINLRGDKKNGTTSQAIASTDTLLKISNATTDAVTVLGNGDTTIAGLITITGALDHNGSNIGFFGVAPAVRAAAYTVTNLTTDRSYDADTVAIAELADVVGTLIADLKTYGLLQ